MRPRRLLILLSVLVLGAVVGAPAALALSPVVRDCRAHHDNAITGHYTVAELQAALNGMPSEIRQYTDCAQVIQTALTAAQQGKLNLNGGGGGGGSGVPGWLIAVIVVVAIAGAGAGFVALRRR